MESAAPVPVYRTQIPHRLVWDGMRHPSVSFYNTNLMWTVLDGIRYPTASLTKTYPQWNSLSQRVSVSLCRIHILKWLSLDWNQVIRDKRPGN